MKAIIPVAGVGERMRPHTYATPKVLLPVAGKPILGHIVDDLINLDIKNITFVVGHLGEKIKEYINKNYDITASFVEQPQRLGLGHAIWLTRDLHFNDTELLIILGDTIFKANLVSLIKQEGNFIALKEVVDPRRFGIAELDSCGEFIVGVEEKPEYPKSNLALVGIYLIRQPNLLYQCLDELIEKGIKTKCEYQITDALSLMIEKEAKLRPFFIEGWYDCGKPETLLSTNRELLRLMTKPAEAKRYQESFPAAIINMPVFISSSAILNNAIIGPNVSIGDETEIKNAVIQNSVIGNNSRVENISLRDSIIGNEARVCGKEFILNIGDSSAVKIYNEIEKKSDD